MTCLLDVLHVLFLTVHETVSTSLYSGNDSNWGKFSIQLCSSLCLFRRICTSLYAHLSAGLFVFRTGALFGGNGVGDINKVSYVEPG